MKLLKNIICRHVSSHQFWLISYLDNNGLVVFAVSMVLEGVKTITNESADGVKSIGARYREEWRHVV